MKRKTGDAYEVQNQIVHLIDVDYMLTGLHGEIIAATQGGETRGKDMP